MNLANQLTVARILLAFLFTAILLTPFPFSATVALAVFVLAALTDLWDGRLARGRCGITPFGQLMDPLADKVMVSAAFICLCSPATNGIVPAWIAVIVISREFLVTGLRLLAAGDGMILSAGRWGKHKTTWQMILIIATLVGLALQQDLLPVLLPAALRDGADALFDPFFPLFVFWLSCAVAALTVISGWVYFHQNFHLIIEHSNVRGAPPAASPPPSTRETSR